MATPSLLLIPDRYKASKLYSQIPDSGAGDLAFTRANDTATRVNSQGLIEKVRTNLALQSNQFDTTWVNTRSTNTSGQAGYDGTSNAWLLQSTASPANEAYIRQTITASGSNTFSIYAKAGTSNFIAFYIDATAGADPFAFFNLSTGAVGSTSATATASIVSVGSGWYRCSAAFNATITTVDVYVADADGSFNSTSGANILIQNAQLEAGDIATPYIPTTTAAVSVGPVANIPRIDYTGGGCGKLLLEPQRTNLLLFSEQFDNAGWTKTNVTITANNEVSPDGYTNADKITDNANNTQHRLSQAISVTSGTSYTASIFVKNDNKGDFAINFTAAGFSSTQIVFNLINGTVTSGTGTIEDYGNGWYRISATAAANTTGSGTIAFNLGNGGSYVGSSQSVFIYGAQLEAGSVATSYIPTLGASVTRSADAASKTGISSLIGQQEGVLYAEILRTQSTANDLFWITLSDGSINNWLFFGTEGTGGRFYVRASNTVIFDQYPAISLGRHKLALAYKSGSIAVYIDGAQLFTSSASFTIGSLTGLALGQNQSTLTGSVDTAGGVIASAVYPTRLTNAELAALTTL